MIKRSIALPLIAALASCAGPTPNLEPPEFEGMPISSLTLIWPESTEAFTKKRIRSHIRSQKGTTYAQDRLDQDIRAAYNSGLVDDIEFFAESRNDSVRVTAYVTPSVLLR